MSRRLAKSAKAVQASPAEACGQLAGGSLCEAALQELVELVLESGGLSEQDAMLLLAILSRLERLQDAEGPGAALHAARAIRQIWMEGDSCEEMTALLN